jgi:uncharacterized protein YodC (DUF2158 family)
MEELEKFREFLNEEKFKVGDKVTMKGGGDEMEVTDSRRMFGSKINAYSVKKSDGEEVEYDESQLKLAESLLNESTPGYDTRKQGEALPTLESVKAAYEAKNDLEEDIISLESGFVEVSVQEVMDHLKAFRDGVIEGEDLAQAIEEIVVGRTTAPGMEE